MTTLTTRERMLRVYRHEEPDRVPVYDSIWAATLERWRREGLPAGVQPADFFGWDAIRYLHFDNSPRYPERILEETDQYRIFVTKWGVTQRAWKHQASVPEFLDFTVVDRDSWSACKARMTPDEDRIDWPAVDRAWQAYRAEDAWIIGSGWFGFDVLHSWFVGTERVLIAMATDPEWVKDMIDTMLDLHLALMEMAWDRGYTFDCLRWPDDLAFVKGPFFSPETYRQVVQPAHRKACDWAHDRGIYALLHTDGNIWPLLPDIVDAGVDGLNPLEQKAGMDLGRLKAEYGDRLVFDGGLDVRRMSQPEAIEETVRTTFAAAMPDGGFVYHSDHSVPSDVSFADYCRVMALVRHYGRY